MKYIIIAYLIGCIIDYPMFKKYWHSSGCEWTRGVRIMAIFFSVFSWGGVIASIIGMAMNGAFTDDRRAKW